MDRKYTGCDTKKKERLEEGLCKECYYFRGSPWAGQSFTTKNCEGCGIEMEFSTTDTDKYCKECSEAKQICKHCGAKLN